MFRKCVTKEVAWKHLEKPGKTDVETENRTQSIITLALSIIWEKQSQPLCVVPSIEKVDLHFLLFYSLKAVRHLRRSGKCSCCGFGRWFTTLCSWCCCNGACEHFLLHPLTIQLMFMSILWRLYTISLGGFTLGHISVYSWRDRGWGPFRQFFIAAFQ